MFLFTLAYALSLVSASTSNKCESELESVISSPKPYSESYLRKLAGRLAQYSGLLFTAQGASFVSSFEQEYGVTVTLQSPFFTCPTVPVLVAETCYSVTENVVYVDFNNINYPFNITQSGPITSISIASMNGSVGSSKIVWDTSQFFNVSLQPPTGSPGPVLQTSCTIDIGPFSIGFSDESTIPFDCTNFDSGVIFAPTTPLAQFDGVEANGEWNLILDAADIGTLEFFTIDYCVANDSNNNAVLSSCSLSSDIARSNLNIPGYRYDSAAGMAYLTILLRNVQGEEVYATISRPINGMIIKK